MPLTELELDTVYTQFAKTMTAIGEERSHLFLARFALLAMCALGDAKVVERLIGEAADISMQLTQRAAGKDEA
jgi:hypothetical protein